MPYSPRTREDILKDLLALVVSRSELSDVAEGSVLSHILGAVSEDLEGVEFSLKQLRDAFVLENSTGEALDLRVSEFPGANIVRKPPTFASGAALRLTRNVTDAVKDAGSFTIPKGTKFGRTDSSVTYRTIADVTIAQGDLTFPPANSTSYVTVIAEASGIQGNAPGGVINKVISNIPELAVEQIVAITGGGPQEQDAEFRTRAQLYLASLVRCQPAALVYLAKSFVSSEGVQFKHASVFEDHERPGYAELIVDDGSGMAEYIKDGTLIEGTAPSGGQVTLYYEAPAANPPRLRVDTGGGYQTKDWITGAYPAPVVLEERGLMYLKNAVKLSSGHKFKLDEYEVYTGPIQELQDLIEGDSSNPFGAAGYRASGTRVRVRPPEISFIENLKLRVTLEGYTEVEAAKSDISSVVQEFIGDLGPGDILRFSRLCADVLNRVPAVLDCFVESAGGQTGVDRIHPATPKTVLRLGINTFSIVPMVAE